MTMLMRVFRYKKSTVANAVASVIRYSPKKTCVQTEEAGNRFRADMVAHLGTELRQANAARADPALMRSASSPSVDIDLTTRSAVDRIG